MRLKLAFAAYIATLAGLYAPANAQGTAQTLQDFEMAGTWAQNCSAPNVGDNVFYRQWWDGSQAMLTVSANGKTASVPVNAREITLNKIVVTANDLSPPYSGQTILVFTRYDDQIMLTDDRMKGTVNGKPFEKIIVFGGLWRWDDATPDNFAGSARAPTGWMKRCGN